MARTTRKMDPAAQLRDELDDLLPELGEVQPLPTGPGDDLVRVARALATGAAGRGLGPDVCSRLYAELRGIYQVVVAGEIRPAGGVSRH